MIDPKVIKDISMQLCNREVAIFIEKGNTVYILRTTWTNFCFRSHSISKTICDKINYPYINNLERRIHAAPITFAARSRSKFI